MSTYSEALARIGGLSHPDKMPCASWSISAKLCPLGSLLSQREGSTCHDCYALKGMYVMPNVVAAMDRRYARLTEWLADPEAFQQGAEDFAHVLNARCARTHKRIDRGQTVANDGRVFRWHDSGDLQNVRHFDFIVAVARRTPDVDHWLPTREAGIVRDWLSTHPEGLPTNLRVRISAPMVNSTPSGVAETLVTTTRNVMWSGVYTDGVPPGASVKCPAYQNDGQCGDCRQCWSPNIDGISYPLH